MIQEDRLVRRFAEWVAIDSPSLGERQLADTVIRVLLDMGFTVEEDAAGSAIGGNCNNVYAHLPGNANARLPGVANAHLPGVADLQPILFGAHFDTVAPALGKKAIIGADRIIRSGGYTVLGADDLAGLTSIIEAVRSIQEDGKPHRPIELFLSVSEELHLLGSNHMDPTRLTAREAYVLDTSGAPGLGILRAPGHIFLQFDVIGRASHAGIAPEKGVSAITAAARGIAAMRLGKVDSETTANIGQIQGGGETNVVADACRVTAECRSTNQAKLDQLADELCACMEHAASELGATVRISRRATYHPYRIDEKGPLVERFRTACSQLGLEAHLEAGGGGSDNNVLVLHGISGMVLSCGMRQVHSCQEHILVDDLVMTARLVEKLIELS